MISGGFTRGNPNPHWHSIDALNDSLTAPINGWGGGFAWPTASMAIYQPVIVRYASVVKQLWYANNTTATGNYDIGLYDSAGVALLRRGSTAKTTTGAEIVWDCTDTTISPGLYYLALSSNSSTDTFVGVLGITAPLLAATGVLTEAAAFALPATATFAVNQTIDRVPLMGMFLDTRVT